MIFDKNTGKAIAYSPEERSRALDVSLVALADSLGFSPIRQGRHYSLKEMDSLVIYNDRSWNRWSGKGNITGGSQIDFLLEFGSANTVPEAINALLIFKGTPAEVNYARKESSDKDISMKEYVGQFHLPPKNENYKRLFAYLIQTRGLSGEIVSDFVHRKLIYEDAVHHNIVYCGYDPEGQVRYAGLRGTADINGRKFKMDVPGNDKNYGVNIVNKDSRELLVFESVIDCMSYIDLYHDTSSNKLVLGMIEDNPLVQFLKDYDHIDTITFCLDNDAAAQIALYGQPEASDPLRKKGLVKKYESQGYAVSVIVPPVGKDFNESLIESKKLEAACIRAMMLRGYERIENIDGKIAFKISGNIQKPYQGDTAGWVFQYNNWHEVRESLIETPLWEKKEITEQIDHLIHTTEKEKNMRTSETEIQRCLSGMAELGFSKLLDYEKGDLTSLTFQNPNTGEKIGIDGWELVADYLEDRSVFHEDGTLKSEYSKMLQTIKEYEKHVPLLPSESVINYMTGELNYGVQKKEFMEAYDKAEKWKNELKGNIGNETLQVPGYESEFEQPNRRHRSGR